MIILTKVSYDIESLVGVPVTNVAEVTQHEKGGCWVKHWNGTEIRTMVIKDSLVEVQSKIHTAKGHKHD